MSEPMPNPNSRAKQIFAAALSVPVAEREALVAKMCGGDCELVDHVMKLLAAHAAAGDFLCEPSAEVRAAVAATAKEGEPPPEQSGQRIGAYKLLQPIGDGGFGTVWMAEQQEPVRRMVALKLLKLGMDTRQVVARFEQERQALALMDHPNIARVFDAGATERGRPFFVMELVKGQPITDYCDRHGLSIRARLELFTQVCHAVQHAHSKGVIHRDIKPRNVLVATHDGQPLAKVIDFGIAKATGPRLTEKTLFTEHHAMIGTLEYMSPEQVDGALDIDTRTDVYSLGTLLYELLTGGTPFDARELIAKGYAEICRIIREVEPQRPSARVSGTAQAAWSAPASSEAAKSAERIASARHAEARELPGMLRGDLDWIVMKALDKDRGRRYPTPTGFAEDVERFLAGEAVMAAPPGRWYRVRKFARRNRGLVVGVTAVTAALSIGLTAAVLAGRDAYRARKDGAAQGERAELATYVKNLQAGLVQAEARSGDAARVTLDSCAVEQRGWEWRYAQAFAADAPRALPIRGPWVFTPDGNRIVDGTREGLRVWDVRSLLLLATHNASLDLKRNDAPVWSIVSEETGTRLACQLHVRPTARTEHGPEWRAIRTLELATGTWSPTVAVALDAKVEFSPDVRLVAVAGKDGAVVVHDTVTATQVWSTKVASGQVTSLLASRDGDLLLALCPDAKLRAWHFATGNSRYETDVQETRMLLSPSGSMLAVTDIDVEAVDGGIMDRGTGILIDVASGRRVRDEDLVVLNLRDWADQMLDMVTGMAARSQGDIADDRQVRRRLSLRRSWSQEMSVSGDRRRTRVLHSSCLQQPVTWLLEGNHSFVSSIAVDRDREDPDHQFSTQSWEHLGKPRWFQKQHRTPSPDNRLVAVQPFGEMAIFAARPPDYAPAIDGASTRALAFDASAREIVAAYSDCLVSYDPLTGDRLLLGDDQDNFVVAASSADGAYLALATDTGLRMVTAKGGDPVPLADSAHAVRAISLTHDGAYVVALLPTGERDCELRLWDATKGPVIASHAVRVATTAAPPPTLAVAGHIVALGDADGTVRLIDLATSAAVTRRMIVGRGAVSALLFSPDRSLLAIGNDDGVVDVRRVPAFEEIVATLEGHSGVVRAIAFSPDGKRIFTTSTDRTVRVWHSTTGRQLLDLGTPHIAGMPTCLHIAGMPTCLMMTPDGERLVAGYDDGAIRVWDAVCWDDRVRELNARAKR